MLLVTNESMMNYKGKSQKKYNLQMLMGYRQSNIITKFLINDIKRERTNKLSFLCCCQDEIL